MQSIEDDLLASRPDSAHESSAQPHTLSASKAAAMRTKNMDTWILHQVLAGLSAHLKAQFEFIKIRTWPGREHQDLVNATTEHVNSSEVSLVTESSNRTISSDGRPHNKRTCTELSTANAQQANRRDRQSRPAPNNRSGNNNVRPY